MKEIIYCIDKDLSLQTSTLVIKIAKIGEETDSLKFQDKARPFFLPDLEKEISPQDKIALKFLIQEELKLQKAFTEKTLQLHTFHISPKFSLDALKLLGATRKLYFNKKNLSIDFYGKVPLSLEVDTNSDGQIKVFGKFTLNDQVVDISVCDFLFVGPPHFLIKGILLKFIDTDISSKELTKLVQHPLSYTAKEIEEMQEDLEIPIKILDKAKYHLNKDPIPFLVLKDNLSISDLN